MLCLRSLILISSVLTDGSDRPRFCHQEGPPVRRRRPCWDAHPPHQGLARAQRHRPALGRGPDPRSQVAHQPGRVGQRPGGETVRYGDGPEDKLYRHAAGQVRHVHGLPYLVTPAVQLRLPEFPASFKVGLTKLLSLQCQLGPGAIPLHPAVTASLSVPS
jgi:hypothetical protein